MGEKVKIHLRKQYNLFNNNENEYIYTDKYYKSAKEVGILVVGLWDSHNCKVAHKILDEICPKANTFIKKCRKEGMHIIFGSSSLLKNPKYKHLGKNIKAPFQSFKDKGINIPPLPFDDSDGGIVEKNPDFNRKNVGMHPAIEIENGDCMSGNNKEILNYLLYNKVKLLLVVGVHLNMCVLDRPYAIKNLIRYGMKVSLVKDLTDIMHSGKLDNMTRDEAQNKMIDWVEYNICPTTTTEDVTFIKNREIYYIDIDKTICHGDTYTTSKPDMEMIEKINKMYESEKYIIIYWTARGSVSGNDWREFTKKQLNKWGCKYHTIQINKSWFDKLVDDKNILIEDFKSQ